MIYAGLLNEYMVKMEPIDLRKPKRCILDRPEERTGRTKQCNYILISKIEYICKKRL